MTYSQLRGLLLLLIPVLGFAALQAQSLTDEAVPQFVIGLEPQDIGFYETNAAIYQDGSDNLAIIDMSGYHYAYIEQAGSLNAADLLISGRYNQVYVNQNGLQNDVALSLSGEYNSLQLTQAGDNNQMIIGLDQAEQMQIIVNQYGPANVLIHEESGVGGIPMQIDQYGYSNLIINDAASFIATDY